MDSFELLVEEPRIFLPKLFSTLISSGLLIFLLEGSAYREFIRSDPLTGLLLSLAGLLIVSLVGVAVNLLVASMVKNYRESADTLSESISEVVGMKKEIILTAVASMVVVMAINVPAIAGLMFFMIFGSYTALFLGILITAILFLALVFTSYFLPITLLEHNSLSKGFIGSMKSSRENPKEVSAMMVFSLLLFGLAFLSEGYLETLGYLGFVAGRLVSTVVNTYFFVVSPTYYLEN